MVADWAIFTVPEADPPAGVGRLNSDQLTLGHGDKGFRAPVMGTHVHMQHTGPEAGALKQEVKDC